MTLKRLSGDSKDIIERDKQWIKWMEKTCGNVEHNSFAYTPKKNCYDCLNELKSQLGVGE